MKSPDQKTNWRCPISECVLTRETVIVSLICLILFSVCGHILLDWDEAHAYNAEEHRSIVEEAMALITIDPTLIQFVAPTGFREWDHRQDIMDAKWLAIGGNQHDPNKKKVQDNSYWGAQWKQLTDYNVRIWIPDEGFLPTRTLAVKSIVGSEETSFTMGQLVAFYGDYRRTTKCEDGDCYLTDGNVNTMEFKDGWDCYVAGAGSLDGIGDCGWRPDPISTIDYLSAIASGLVPPIGSIGNLVTNAAEDTEYDEVGWWGDELLRLVNVNDWHFSKGAVAWYVGMHRMALLYVKRALEEDPKYWNHALHYEANALHSLTDLFAIGHVVTNRGKTAWRIMFDRDLLQHDSYKWMEHVIALGGGERDLDLGGQIEVFSSPRATYDDPIHDRNDFMGSYHGGPPSLGGWAYHAYSEKTFHDTFNEAGAYVRNLAGDRVYIWGDFRYRLSASEGLGGREAAVKAVRASVQALFDAAKRLKDGEDIETIGQAGSPYFEALKWIPIFIESDPNNYFTGRYALYAGVVDEITGTDILPRNWRDCAIEIIDGELHQIDPLVGVPPVRNIYPEQKSQACTVFPVTSEIVQPLTDWNGLIFDRIDAAVGRPEANKAYLFGGEEYVRYDLVDDAVDPGYPLKTKDHWNGVEFDTIDAAVYAPEDGKFYLFSGDEYVRYDLVDNAVDDGYPLKTRDHWHGVDFDTIDAAVYYAEARKFYLFSADEYVRYDLVKDSVDTGYPLKTREQWHGVDFDRIDAAFYAGYGKFYFFRGDKFVPYDVPQNTIPQYVFAHRVNDWDPIIDVLDAGVGGGNVAGNGIELDVGWGKPLGRDETWWVRHDSFRAPCASCETLDEWLGELGKLLRGESNRSTSGDPTHSYDETFAALWLDIKTPNEGDLDVLVNLVRKHIPSDVWIIYDIGSIANYGLGQGSNDRGYNKLKNKLRSNEGLGAWMKNKADVAQIYDKFRQDGIKNSVVHHGHAVNIDESILTEITNNPIYHKPGDPYRFKKVFTWTNETQATMEAYINPRNSYSTQGQIVGAGLVEWYGGYEEIQDFSNAIDAVNERLSEGEKKFRLAKRSDNFYEVHDVATDVADHQLFTLPDDFSLSQNFPNPFNPGSTIEFTLARSSEVTITIYNSLGQTVRRVVAQTYPAGTHRVQWDGVDDSGLTVSSGVYIYKMQAGDFIASKKMTLVK